MNLDRAQTVLNFMCPDKSLGLCVLSCKAQDAGHSWGPKATRDTESSVAITAQGLSFIVCVQFSLAHREKHG
jgi:hypothetical protein